MENKENYNVILTDLDEQFITSTFYDNLSSYNVITIDDVNNLVLSTNYCIDTLSTICNSDEFCQLITNAYTYYVSITDRVFPRVKYYNDRSGIISAVFPQSRINDIPLSSNISINLLTYNKDAVVRSINGAGGDIIGIEEIKINGRIYKYDKRNKGKINLGSFKTFNSEIVRTINGETGDIIAPIGITIDGTAYPCDENGILDLNNIQKFDQYITLKGNNNKQIFNSLLINSVNENNPSSVINKQYLKNRQNDLQVCSTYLSNITHVDTEQYNPFYSIEIPPVIDNKFISYIYGIQNGSYKEIVRYDTSGENTAKFETNLYANGIPLTFVALGGSGVLKLNSRKNWDDNHPEDEQGAAPVTLSYSLNYAPYKEFPTTGIQLNKGDVLSLSGDNDHFCKDDFGWYTFSFDNSNNEKVNYACYGNIMSLVNWDTEIKTDWQFYALFSGSNLLKAPQLPITTLTPYCYDSLFQDCHNLIVPPILPATTLADNCYRDMFWNCTSLSTVPSLPATGLTSGCYFRMFAGCTSLTILPYYLLPATELAPWCYYAMFWGCENLTDSPLLPAQLPPYNTEGECDPNYVNCYGNIFSNCPNLTAAHLDCDPARLIQHNAPPEIEYINGEFNEDAGKAWMQNYKNTVGTDAAREWLMTHNYANEWNNNWIEGPSVEGDPATQPHNYPITLYNTMLWQQVRDDSNNNGVEKFYYDYNWQSFNYYWIKRVARSLEDTPLSFELISGVTDGAFCFRAQQYNLTTTVISKFSYKNKKDYVTGGVNYEGMNVKYKYYHPVSKEISGTNRDENGWKKITWDWESDPSKYTLCHDGFAFNNTTSGKNGLIFSLSSNYMSQGFDEANNRILFWRLCHQNGCKFKIIGNLNSMNGWRNNLKPYEFFALFSDDQHGSKHHTYGFVDAHQLILPAKNLNEHCYEKMFEKCSGLVNGPTFLPATDLSKQCYCQMFAKCSSLISAPNINAKNLAYRSCDWMFEGCKNLVAAPSISIFTNSENRGLKAMFYNCNKLKYCQDIVISTIKTEQCSEMFKNCTELLYPPSISTNKVEANGCAFMFNTCRDLTYIPPLPATDLAEHCYHRMFRYGDEDNQEMKELISKYVYLPATDDGMGDYCYRQMFFNTNVNYIVVKFTDWMNKELWPNTVDYTTPPYPQETYLRTKTAGWLGYQSTVDRSTQSTFTGTFVCYPNLSIEIRDNNHIPTNWTVMNQVNGVNLIFRDVIQTGSIDLYYLKKNF